MLYPDGSIQVRGLADGSSTIHVLVTPGKCESDPSNITAATGADVVATISANGTQIGPDQATRFTSARKALLCRTSKLRNRMRAFAGFAGVAIDAASTMLLPAVPAKSGEVHPDDAAECALAMATTALALVELDAAYADPELWPAVPALERAYLGAATAATVACANENRAPPGGN